MFPHVYKLDEARLAPLTLRQRWARWRARRLRRKVDRRAQLKIRHHAHRKAGDCVGVS